MSTTKKKKRKPLTRAQRIAHNLRGRERYLEKKMQAAPKEKKPSVVEIKRAARARVVAAKIIENPALSVSEAARAVGLPESVATHPAQIVNSPEWNKLLDEMLPQGEVLAAHRGLLRASRIEHMVFPINEPSDETIAEMLIEVNCTVRKIVHGEQARHVYFFAPDNRARKEGIEMAYKLRASFAGDKAQVAFSLVALAKMRDAQRALQSKASAPQLPRAVE